MKPALSLARLAFMLGAVLTVAAWAGRPARADMPAETRTVVAQPIGCDRACLYALADRYMAALVRKTAAGLPLAARIKFTENEVAMPIGEGAWNTADALGPHFTFADVPGGQVGWFGVIVERGVKSFYAMRMRVRGGLIDQVETVISRPGVTRPYGDPEKYDAPEIVSQSVRPAERRLRERMVSIADGYFDTLQLNDGELFTKFTPDCSRRENGVWTASDPHPDPASAMSRFGRLTCEEGFTRGNYRWDDRLRDRRYVLVDEEQGLVLASTFIDHAGRLLTYATTDGKTEVANQKSPHTFAMLELFKIVDGKIRHAEAVFLTVPYYTPSPWIDQKIWPDER